MTDDKKFRNWDERYNSSEYLFGTEPNDFLASIADRIQPSSRVLCLADGEGRNGVYLASLSHLVTSIDQSRTGLDKAERLAAEKNVPIQTIQADLGEYKLGVESWDCIVSIFFHLSPELRSVIYPRVISALAPGGLLILESYTPEQLNYGTGGPPLADHMLTPDDLEGYFRPLTIEHLWQREREVIEGSGHTGMASVVQLLARKPA